jgi:hypothetical protein
MWLHIGNVWMNWLIIFEGQKKIVILVYNVLLFLTLTFLLDEIYIPVVLAYYQYYQYTSCPIYFQKYENPRIFPIKRVSI